MNEQQFTERLHECLDARREPLDDGELCAYLESHPEQLEAFAQLQASLAALPTTARRTAPARRRGFVAAALLLASVATAIALASRRPPPLGRVLAASIETLPATAGLSVTWHERRILLDRPDARIEQFTRHSVHR
jgi:anti-sigma factor RsiW